MSATTATASSTQTPADAAPLLHKQLDTGSCANGEGVTPQEDGTAGSSAAVDSAAAPGAQPAAERKPSPPFRSAAQLAASTPATVTWIAWPLVVAGGTTALVGKVKAAGKSTLVAYAAAAALAGEPFLGQPTVKSPVVWLTEENDPSFKELLGRANLLDNDNLVILSHHLVSRETWPQIVERAIVEAERIGAKWIIVDTPGVFTGLTGDAENDAGEAAAVVRTISELAGPRGIGVVFVVHERKSGGEIGDAARGSSAFIGAVDHIVSLRRHEGAARPNIRRLETLGRFGSPTDHLIELADEGYVLLGTLEEVKEQTSKNVILGALPTSTGSALTVEQLVEDTGLGRTKVRELLAELEKLGEVLHVGLGHRGSPQRYFRGQPQAAPPAPVSAAAGGPPGAAAEKLHTMLSQASALQKVDQAEAYLRDACGLTEERARQVIEEHVGKLWEIMEALDEGGTQARFLVALPKEG